jgi:hypothetical protein
MPGPIEGSGRIGFPEIDTGTEPVVFVLTDLEGSVFQKAFGNGAVATMIRKDERSGEFVHLNQRVSR